MPPRPPNILFLMTDQMQGRVLEDGHPCLTPNFDRLIARGVRFARAYTPNAVCSPARASLMTGLLPHSHGVLSVTHCTFDDESVLRTDRPHWAQRLRDAGYRTGYFGKWHVERTEDLELFGWQVDGGTATAMWREHARAVRAQYPAEPHYSLRRELSGPEGYPDALLYGVHDQPAEARGMGITVGLAEPFLRQSLAGEQPWCCFVSVVEPHDPFLTSREAYAQYDPGALPPAPNWDDDLAGRPNLYRKAQQRFAGLSLSEKQEAAACYYASITEIDRLFGRLIDLVDGSGQADNTLIVLTTDHGEFLGAHGLYQKNVGAFEEAYSIPLVMAGPGCAEGVVSQARVGLQDVCPTLLELAGAEPIETPDARPFTAALRDPEAADADFGLGYAEYFGTRYYWSQRIVWDGPWKLVWNGFDFDELYNLEEDPYELHNLADDPAHRDRLRTMMQHAWRRVRDTGDHPLYGSKYLSLRLAPFGPGIADGT